MSNREVGNYDNIVKFSVHTGIGCIPNKALKYF